jgi:hypothetical protein
MAGVIDTAYVRIRPLDAGLRTEMVAQVRGALAGVQAEVRGSSQTMLAATKTEVAANNTLVTSYIDVGDAARVAGREAAAGAEAAGAAATGAAEKTVAASDTMAAAGEKVKGKFLDVGKALGIAFGTVELVKFVKDVTGSAASVQKSGEVIRSTFGPDASKVVVGFGESAAAGLNISASAADAFGARMGILLQNLRITPEIGAKMTVGLEQLAGALGKIRGVDPSPILATLDRALLGNTRSLKALGIAISPTDEKQVALTLHLIKHGEALTNAARAEAIYVLATANLPKYLDQAAKHSGDLANVQQHLAIEWSNAKDIIGSQLLPAFDKAETKLGDFLQKENDTGALQRQVNTVLQDAKKVIDGVKDAVAAILPYVKDLINFLGGAKQAVKDFILVWAAFKAASIISSLSTIAGSIVKIGLTAKATAAEAGIFRASLLELSGVSAILIPIGVAIAAHEVADKVKKLQEMVIAAQSRTVAPTSGVFRTEVPVISDEIKKLKSEGIATGEILTKLRAQLGGSAIGDQIIAAAFVLSASKVTAYTKKLQDQIEGPARNALKQAGSDAAQSFKDGLAQGLTAGAGGGGVGDAIAKSVTDAENKARAASLKAGEASIQAAKAQLAQLKDRLAQTITQNTQQLNDTILQAKQNLIQIGTSLVTDMTNAIEAPLNLASQNIQAATDKVNLWYDKASQTLDTQSRKIQTSMDAIAVVFDAKQAALDKQTRAINASEAQISLDSAKRSLAQIQQSVLLPGGVSLAKDPKKAIKQLEADAKAHPFARFQIEEFIDQYRSAVDAVASAGVNVASTKLQNQRATKEAPLNRQSDVLRLKKDTLDSVKASKDAILQLQNDRLAVDRDTAQKEERIVAREIASLTAEVNSGRIKITTFNSRIAALLRSQAPEFAKAGKILGEAFRLQYQSEVGELLGQAKAVVAGPHRPGTGQETKIIRPLQTLEKQTYEVNRITHSIMNKQTTIQNRIALNTQRAAKAAENAGQKARKAAQKAAAGRAANAAVVTGATANDVMPGRQNATSKQLTGST